MKESGADSRQKCEFQKNKYNTNYLWQIQNKLRTQIQRRCVQLPKTDFRKYIYKYNKNTKQTLDTIRYKETFLCERERSRQTPEVCAASPKLNLRIFFLFVWRKSCMIWNIITKRRKVQKCGTRSVAVGVCATLKVNLRMFRNSLVFRLMKGFILLMKQNLIWKYKSVRFLCGSLNSRLILLFQIYCDSIKFTSCCPKLTIDHNQ